MKNLTIFNQMLADYEQKAFTNNYILGFTYKKTVYMAIVKADLLPMICCQDLASRGAGFSIRFCPTVAQKLLLLTYSKPMCSEHFFMSEVINSKYNQGEIFEKMVTELFGQTWEKDTIPFYKGADLTADGIHYQIKFQRATFTNEKILKNISKNY